MLTLGLSGGLDSVHEQAFDAPSNYPYDGAAVLLENGSVVAAFEEERLNRIKHSNKLPMQAIARCLRTRDVDLTDNARVVGSSMMNRSAPSWRDQLDRLVSLPPYVQVMRIRRGEPGHGVLRLEIRTSYDPPRQRTISAELGDALIALERATSAAKLLHAYPHVRQLELMDELETLWAERLIVLVPDGVAEPVI